MFSLPTLFRDWSAVVFGIAFFVLTTPLAHALSPEATVVFTRSGVPRSESYAPTETGIRGDFHKIANLPGGEVAFLTEAGLFAFDGTNWARTTDLEWPVDSLLISSEEALVTHSEGISLVSRGPYGDYQARTIAKTEDLENYIHALKFVATARGYVFGVDGDNLVEVAPSGEVTLHRLENWAQGCFAIGDEFYVLGGRQTLLNRWDWESRKLVNATPLLDGAGIYEWLMGVEPRAAGGVWLRTQNDNFIAFDGERSWAWPGNRTLDELGVKHRCFREVGADRLAIGTSSKGLFVFDEQGRLGFQYSKEQGLDDNYIDQLGIDAQGGIWVSTRNRITRIPVDARTVVFNQSHGLIEKAHALAFFQDRLFVGTPSGVYASNPAPVSRESLFERSVDNGDTLDLLAYDGHLFVGGSHTLVMTPRGELRRLDEVGATSFHQPSRFPEVVLGCTFQGIQRYDKRNGKWIKTGDLKGPSLNVYSIAESENGELFGSLGNDRIVRIELSPDGGSYEVIELPLERKNGMWSAAVTIGGQVFVNGQPCLRWDSEAEAFVEAPQMHYYVGSPPYGYEQVFGTSPENAYVAVSSRSGRTVPRPPLEVVGDISNLGNDVDTRALCIAYDDAGNVWSGGSFGLAFSKLQAVEDRTREVRPRIHRLQSMRDEALFPVSGTQESPIELGAEQNSLLIEVEYPIFVAASHHQYQIYIEGLDTAWPEYSFSGRREINNLPAGSFTLMVNAKDSSGRVAKAREVHFRVIAPWYRQYWAYALYAIGLAIFVTSIALFYNRVQIRRARDLQRLVDERTREIADKNAELESQAQTLERQNHELEEKTTELQTTTESLTETLSQLHEMQDQLVATARTAGKAEIATNVLHNVGNVLNSINISLSVLSEKVANSKVKKLLRLAAVVEQRQDDLLRFLTDDPKGKKVPEFLFMISQALHEEVSELSHELGVMEEDVGHVKRIIAAQQTHAKSVNLTQDFSLYEICESALAILVKAGSRSGIEIINEVPETLTLHNDKHRLLEIILNLIGNAQDSINERKPDVGMIRISVEQLDSENRLVLSIEDNGIGIEPGNIARLFKHGFTTKDNGHGFGLHSCANAALVLGGKLSLVSSGLGHGATATIELPIRFEEELRRGLPS